MNLYRMELKRSLRGLLLWVLCQCALIGMGYLEFAMVFKGNADVTEVLRQLPPAFMGMMGVPVGTDFTVVNDFFLVMADFGFYIMAAYAGLLGFGLLSREEKGGTAEFLYTKPLSRRGIFGRKCLAGVTCCAIMGAATGCVTLLTFGRDPGGNLLVPVLVWAGTSMLLQLVYFLAGAMFAACCSPARGMGYNLVFLFGTILVSRVIDMAGLTGPILALGARYYFPMARFVSEGGFGAWPWALCAVWIVLFIALANWRLEKRDL